MSDKRVVVVTGGNRGIGLEICRQLAGMDLNVVLTSRHEKDGLQAVAGLERGGLTVDYCQLDVCNPAHMVKLKEHLSRKFGRCDALVNNAGLFSEAGSMQEDLKTVREVMDSNVYGPLLLCQTLVPLMKKNNYGRIVNMSSGLGQLNSMGSGYLAYRMSKASINVLTRVMAAELTGHNILVNSMSPGWVKTRMGGANAPRSVEQGADTAVWLANLPDGGPTGKFFEDRKEIPW